MLSRTWIPRAHTVGSRTTDRKSILSNTSKQVLIHGLTNSRCYCLVPVFSYYRLKSYKRICSSRLPLKMFSSEILPRILLNICWWSRVETRIHRFVCLYFLALFPNLLWPASAITLFQLPVYNVYQVTFDHLRFYIREIHEKSVGYNKRNT